MSCVVANNDDEKYGFDFTNMSSKLANLHFHCVLALPNGQNMMGVSDTFFLVPSEDALIKAQLLAFKLAYLQVGSGLYNFLSVWCLYTSGK